MAQILAFLVGFAGRFLTGKLLYFVALKGFLFLLFTVVVPTMIVTLIGKILKYTLDYAYTQLQFSNLSQFSFDVTGMGGYLAAETGLAQCFAIIISAVALRAILNMITTRI